MALNFTPGYNPNIAKVNPRLVDIVTNAASGLPQGYHVTITEGYNPSGHVANSQHHIAGMGAMDVQIWDPSGNAIPNKGQDTTGMYKLLAQNAYSYAQDNYPDLSGKLAWGGAFGTTATSGVPDLMHFDLGGERGGGNGYFPVMSKLGAPAGDTAMAYAATGAPSAAQTAASGEAGGQPKTIRYGSTGAPVRTLQSQLAAAGYNIGKRGVDGTFGTDTRKALIAYQNANGLTPDGVAGPQTLGALTGGPGMGGSQGLSGAVPGAPDAGRIITSGGVNVDPSGGTPPAPIGAADYAAATQGSGEDNFAKFMAAHGTPAAAASPALGPVGLGPIGGRAAPPASEPSAGPAVVSQNAGPDNRPEPAIRVRPGPYGADKVITAAATGNPTLLKSAMDQLTANVKSQAGLGAIFGGPQQRISDYFANIGKTDPQTAIQVKAAFAANPAMLQVLTPDQAATLQKGFAAVQPMGIPGASIAGGPDAGPGASAGGQLAMAPLGRPGLNPPPSGSPSPAGSGAPASPVYSGFQPAPTTSARPDAAAQAQLVHLDADKQLQAAIATGNPDTISRAVAQVRALQSPQAASPFNTSEFAPVAHLSDPWTPGTPPAGWQATAHQQPQLGSIGAAKGGGFFPQSEIDLARQGSVLPALNAPANAMEAGNWLVKNFGSGSGAQLGSIAAPAGGVPSYARGIFDPRTNPETGSIRDFVGGLSLDNAKRNLGNMWDGASGAVSDFFDPKGSGLGAVSRGINSGLDWVGGLVSPPANAVDKPQSFNYAPSDTGSLNGMAQTASNDPGFMPSDLYSKSYMGDQPAAMQTYAPSGSMYAKPGSYGPDTSFSGGSSDHATSLQLGDIGSRGSGWGVGDIGGGGASAGAPIAPVLAAAGYGAPPPSSFSSVAPTTNVMPDYQSTPAPAPTISPTFAGLGGAPLMNMGVPQLAPATSFTNGGSNMGGGGGGAGGVAAALINRANGGSSGGGGNSLAGLISQVTNAANNAGYSVTPGSDWASLASQGYSMPNFSSGSGGANYAYQPNGQGGGTFVDQNGTTWSY